MSRESEQVVKNIVRVVAGTTLVATGTEAYQLATNQIPTVEAQTYPTSTPIRTPRSGRTVTPTPTPGTDCAVEVRVFSQYFQDRGGATYPDGRPQFQKEIDEILGPAQNRLFIIETQNKSFNPLVVQTDENGKASGRIDGKSDVTQNNRRAINLSRTSLDNGDISNFLGFCGLPVQLDVMSERGSLPVTLGPTATPRGIEVLRIPGSIDSLQSSRERAATAVAIDEANRMATTTVQEARRAAQEATRTTATVAATGTAVATSTPTGAAAPEGQEPQSQAEGGPQAPSVDPLTGLHDSNPVFGFIGDYIFSNIGKGARTLVDNPVITVLGVVIGLAVAAIWRYRGPLIARAYRRAP